MQESSLQQLLDAYGRRQIPSPAEELHWAGLVRRWLDYPGGRDAAPLAIQRAGRRGRNRLVEGNMRWVVAIAKKYCCSNYSDDRLMEAIQWGSMGLIRAVERFDHTRGYKLSTFSYHWILQGIQRGDESRNVVRMSADVLLELRKLERAAAVLAERNEPVTPDRLGELTSIPSSRVKIRLAAMPLKHMLSLNATRSDGSDTPLVDLIADHRESPDGEVERQVMTEWLDQQVALLPERQRTVINAALQGRDRKDTARELGISTSRVGQTRARAIQSLRHQLEQPCQTMAA